MAINFPSTTGQATDGSFTHVVGYVTYKWNGVSWNASVSGEGGGGGSAGTLNDVTDVTITSATQHQLLAYNGSGWINTYPSIQHLSDVKSDANPSDGDLLQWVDGNSQYEYRSPYTLVYNVAEAGGAPTTGQVLGWDGTNFDWVTTPTLSNIVDSAQGVNVTGKVATTDGIDIDTGGNINAAGTSIDFQSATISFSGASISGLQGEISDGVDFHLNQSTANDGEVLSWNATGGAQGTGDYEWVADQTGGGGAAGLSVSIPHGATDLTKTFVAADANSISGTVTSQLRIYVLPQGSTLNVGDQFYIFDIGDENLSGNAATYNISIGPHSGDRIQGAAADTPYIIATNAGSVRLIWMGSTYQWRVFQ
ncbi:MAG: hypothetical protein CMO44_07425 [Verrucomicrobiales bacterium]|nr:hypothetical protein [Verrucomicrobiales bacterium]